MSDFLGKRIIKVVFDSAGTDSADVSNKTIAAHPSGVFIPDNAIVTDAFYEVNTTFTSDATDAGTIAVHVEGANDVVSALAISDATAIWDAGIHGTIVGSAGLDSAQGNVTDISDQTSIVHGTNKGASFIKTDGQEEITFTVAVEALLLGKLTFYVEYVIGL